MTIRYDAIGVRLDRPLVQIGAIPKPIDGFLFGIGLSQTIIDLVEQLMPTRGSRNILMLSLR